MIVARCLSYLATQIPGKPLSRNMRERVGRSALAQKWPLLQFAALNWLSFCLDSLRVSDYKHDSWTETANMVQKSTDFLEQQLSIMTCIEAFYTYGGCPIELISSTRDAIRMSHLGHGAQPGQASYFITHMKELVDELATTHNSWGDTLRLNPAEVWGDVTIFTKSRLEKEEAGDDLVSTATPVFSTSVSSADAATLGVLSIFPNKLFSKAGKIVLILHGIQIRRNDRQIRVGAPRTPSEFANASSGWLATYETFSIGESRSDSKSIVTIPLDTDDVIACLRQSLRFAAGTWKCSFPLTIAPGLDKISILNNIMLTNAHRGTYRQLPIRPDPHPQLQLAWNPKTIFTTRYSYQIYWSVDSRYVAFTDTGVRNQVFLGIFMNGPLEGQLKLVNSYAMVVPLEVTPSNCTFHPTAPLFLYQSNNSIFLWEIEKCTFFIVSKGFYLLAKVGSMPIHFHKIHCWKTFTNTPTFGIIVFGKTFANNRLMEASICFSPCGKYIAITHHGRTWSELMEVPAELLGQHHRMGKRPLDDEDGELASNKRVRTAETTLALAKLPEVISTAVDLRGGSATGMSATVLQNNDIGELTILNGDTELKSSISVVRFPKTIQMRSASSVVWLPSQTGLNSNAQCRLVVTSKPEGVYYSDEPVAATHLPMVVRKNVRALEVK
ncbi:hypothetical protein PspLS_02436 [Pyricularia sp. CBS 133598]|nr:hypothetical protein PspLS_02436 [Pyricularia sp. CBS 133598]